ncbi:hypothetical protein, partial [Shewanella algae]|uniref:hypothetical protein n=1 Tax=Shewanella algae TaxID=38313 RepID=UPI00313E2209
VNSSLYIQIVTDLIIAFSCLVSIPLLVRWSRAVSGVLWRILFPVGTIQIEHKMADGSVVKKQVDLSSKKSLLEQLDERF